MKNQYAQRTRLSRVAAAVVAALCSAIASAQIWNEVGNAGDLVSTAQHTVGAGPLTTINGTLGQDPQDGVDLYCIHIDAPVSAFSASTPQAVGDHFGDQLWLFDANGFGVTHNDTFAVGAPLSGQFVPSPGMYFLAVSNYEVEALDASLLSLWANNTAAVERAPDGSNGVLDSWPPPFVLALPNYTVNLTGASFCEVPEPGSLALVILGTAAVLHRRRGA